jgi:hypothetical protein
MFENEDFLNNNEFMKSTVPGFWSEKIYVATKDYEIIGYVFMPKTGKKNRLLSDILNGKKRFVAIKDAEISNKQYPDRKTELHDFIQINLDSIVLIRPIKEN